MTAPTEPGVYEGVDERVYHGDRGSLSSSGARRLLELAPAEWLYELDHPERREPTPEMEKGTATHTLVLGVGPRIVEVRAPDWKRPADQKRRKQIRARGEVPLLTKDVAVVEAMAEAVFDHPEAAEIFADGLPELSAYGYDELTGVLMRARTDWLDKSRAADLKTCESSSPEDFEDEVHRFGYHVQEWWYRAVLAAAGRPLDDFAFVAVAKRPPHLVAVHRLKPRLVELGGDIGRRALAKYARCRESGEWPGHPSGSEIDLPDWVYKKEMFR
ncbi:PD-(D/E)XK nuclease-like domain-containing protein [Nocardia sp. NPDC003999]